MTSRKSCLLLGDHKITSLMRCFRIPTQLFDSTRIVFVKSLCMPFCNCYVILRHKVTTLVWVDIKPVFHFKRTVPKRIKNVFKFQNFANVSATITPVKTTMVFNMAENFCCNRLYRNNILTGSCQTTVDIWIISQFLHFRIRKMINFLTSTFMLILCWNLS